MLPLFISLVFTMAGVGIYADSNRSLRSDVEAVCDGAFYVVSGAFVGFAVAAAIILLAVPGSVSALATLF